VLKVPCLTLPGCPTACYDKMVFNVNGMRSPSLCLGAEERSIAPSAVF
jgi:hypothetical protein